MRKIREVLRLHWQVGLSARKIGRSCRISHNTATDYIGRAQAAGLVWPLPAELDDDGLELLLYPEGTPPSLPQRRIPDWQRIKQELQNSHVTLNLLWEEYQREDPSGYQYSQFCELYRRWSKKLDVVLRQDHKAGEKLFVDYAGPTVPWVDPATGEIKQANIFVAVLGASNYTYAEATAAIDQRSWIQSHINAFEYLGGVPAIVVSDNLKSGVAKACRYEPDLNPIYQDMASFYGTVVIPARVRKPRDKAKVETGILIVERWILAALRHQTFFSLSELNQAISRLLEQLNHRPFKKLPGNRSSLFASLDKPALLPLPVSRYEYAEWKKARVSIDYHIEVEGHYYSLPYTLVGQEVEARITQNTVEIFHRGKRVASHRRSFQTGRHTTISEHMPKSHQRYLEWTPSRLVHWAESIGESTANVVGHILATRPHPEQGFRSCLGLFRLGKSYGNSRLEAACQRAITIQGYSYKSVASILKTGLDRRPLPAESPPMFTIEHDNIRGSEYYH